jgi:hypothetical protein
MLERAKKTIEKVADRDVFNIKSQNSKELGKKPQGIRNKFSWL